MDQKMEPFVEPPQQQQQQPGAAPDKAPPAALPDAPPSPQQSSQTPRLHPSRRPADILDGWAWGRIARILAPYVEVANLRHVCRGMAETLLDYQVPRLTWHGVDNGVRAAACGSCLGNLDKALGRFGRLGVLRQHYRSAYESAAASAKLDTLDWLRERGYACDERLERYCMNLLARFGRPERTLQIDWSPVLQRHPQLATEAAACAAYAGNMSLLNTLLRWEQRRGGCKPLEREDVVRLLRGVAFGCDVKTLQHLFDHHMEGLVGRRGCRQLSRSFQSQLISIFACAASSPTSDWQDKVEWLERRGLNEHNLPPTEHACSEAAMRPDARSRVEWLVQRGHPVGHLALAAAAERGNMELLRYILQLRVRELPLPAEGLATYVFWPCTDVYLSSLQLCPGSQLPDTHTLHTRLSQHAATAGEYGALACGKCGFLSYRRAIMQELHDRGVQPSEEDILCAAATGDLQLMQWLLELLGGGNSRLTRRVMVLAVRSGSLELVRWLLDKGCLWDESAMEAAAEWGSVHQLELLGSQGCFFKEDGSLYALAAARASVPMLRCLERLGCPWAEDVLASAVRELIREGAGMICEPWPGLEWLAQKSISMVFCTDYIFRLDWQAAIAAAQEHAGCPARDKLVSWLRRKMTECDDRYFRMVVEPGLEFG